MAGARYARRPVYFSDIVVRHDHSARTFADLRGTRWAINEPGSHSGYGIVRYELARRGEHAGFFTRVTETGAHQATLGMILDGEVDASAIDSTVLETEFRRLPALKRRLRIVEAWGPSPVPPWVVSRRLPLALRREVRRIMLAMHRDPGGRAILRAAHMARFASVSDQDYDPIRRMASAGCEAALMPNSHPTP
jgi:phosphonate transport system substrate-binding protein